MANKINFSAELDSGLIEAVRSLAEQDGKQVASVVEQAMVEYVERRRPQARPHVMAKYQESLETFGPLYERLAR